MAFYEVLVQRAWGAPRHGVRVLLADGVSQSEALTDGDGRVVIECDARLVELFVDGRCEGFVRPGTTLVTR